MTPYGDSILARLWDTYVVEAPLFFVAHVLLLAVVLPLMYRFQRAALRDRETLAHEADFLRGMIGLFLIIGIAGTFKGLFQFAIQTLDTNAVVYPEIWTEKTIAFAARKLAPKPGGETVEVALKHAMAQAFPVGLFGLTYTLFLHLGLDAIEYGKLRELAVRKATAPAVDKPATQAQLNALLGEVRLVRLRLQPLAELGNVIDRGLRPVMRDVRRTLARTAKVLEEQGRRLEEGKDALVKAAEGVADSTATLREGAAKTAELAGSAQKAATAAIDLSDRAARTLNVINEKTATLAKEAGEILNKAATTFTTAADQANEITKQLDTFPEKLATKLTDALKRPVDESLKRYETTIFNAIGTAFAPITTRLDEVVQKEETMRQSTDRTLHNITQSQERLDSQVTDSIARLTKSYEGTISSHAGRVATAANDAEASIRDEQQQTTAAVQNVARVAREETAALHGLATTTSAAVHDLSESAHRLRVTMRTLDQIVTDAAQPTGPLRRLKKWVRGLF